MKAPDKIIFLDWDGVICPYNYEIRPEPNSIEYTITDGCRDLRYDKNCVNNFNKIIFETGAKIVVSASIRKVYTFNVLCNQLKACGIDGDIIGITPSLGWRDNEILDYVNKHNPNTYMVIDDECTDLTYHLSNKLMYKTFWKIGLTSDDADDAIKLFKEIERGDHIY